MRFVNQQAFDAPTSRQMAMGVDLRTQTAITDSKGQVLAYAQTGGMMSPLRYELNPGVTLFRFGSGKAGWQGVAKGGWWVEKPEFEKLLAFSRVHDLSIGMSMRTLCLVPPEWSDATLLIRARVIDPLLAWRGLAQNVVTPAKGGGPNVTLLQQNEISARRLHQVFIPGLASLGTMTPGVRVEQDYPLSAKASAQGFIYL